jgi:hypothetical protein
MSHFGDEMARLKSAVGMGFWIAVLVALGIWMAGKGWWLIGHGTVWIGLVLGLVGVLVCVMCARGVWLVVMLLAGYTTPRLARRDFRNTLSNFVMFARSGVWKD